eukprot:748895-Hanusia_phi.AAC.4
MQDAARRDGRGRDCRIEGLSHGDQNSAKRSGKKIEKRRWIGELVLSLHGLQREKEKDKRSRRIDMGMLVITMN